MKIVTESTAFRLPSLISLHFIISANASVLSLTPFLWQGFLPARVVPTLARCGLMYDAIVEMKEEK